MKAPHAETGIQGRLLADLEAQVTLFESPSRIWVACSGGGDSCALLYLLHCLQIKMRSFELCVLHVNYGLRGEESSRDEDWVRTLASRYGCELRVLRIPAEEIPKDRAGLQDWARERRYAWFESMRQPMDWLAIAHHQDDAIETIFARLCRGHSLTAVGGMRKMYKKIWRPLLEWRRDDLLELIQEQGLGVCQDSSNLKPDYTRNRLRLEILPGLAKLFPGLYENLWFHAQDLSDCLDFIASEIPADCAQEFMRFQDIVSLPPVLARDRIAQFIKARFPLYHPHRESLMLIYQALKAGRRLHRNLSPSLSLGCQNGVLEIKAKKQTESPRWLQYKAALLNQAPLHWPETLPGKSKT